MQIFLFGVQLKPGTNEELDNLNLISYYLSYLSLPKRFSLKYILILKSPWPESTSELYRPSDYGMSAKLVPTFADRGYHVVTVTDPYGRILGFLFRSL
jgi:hypothetical protein